ncbi:MAG: ATP/GTP-binding protein [Oligoflexales bacterium]
MAIVNHERNEVSCKIVYFGAPGSGKTQNLRSVYRGSASQQGHQSVIELASPTTGNQYFEFLPVSLGRIEDYHVKLHLFTEPSETFPSVRDVVLQGLDGCVFIVDSQFDRIQENLECIEKSKAHLKHLGYDLDQIPCIYQYNKRDCESAVEVSILSHDLNSQKSPEFSAIATEDKGTLETVHRMAQLILEGLGQRVE